ncbi:hypothetical protein E2C01_055936 [Portunus trituberculatus]|uniref:Uncharacterized protein n=1 Tax=Portunus trituberculatus TaxID=210409 RepID=A0A5B7GWJ4_PORTR|nr:hypothetical protein [Portunus trituberculatus]
MFNINSLPHHTRQVVPYSIDGSSPHVVLYSVGAQQAVPGSHLFRDVIRKVSWRVVLQCFGVESPH